MTDGIRRFAPLVDGSSQSLTDPALLQESRKYYGASLVLVGRSGDAVLVFNSLLRDSPDEDLSPSLFTTRVRDVFNQVKADMQAELAGREAAIREAQERARREQEQQVRAEILSKAVLFERTVEHRPIWQGLLPLGIAQFQNDQDTKGILFLVGEGLMLAGSVTSYWVLASLEGADDVPVNRTLSDVFLVSNWITVAALGVLVGLGAWDGVANLETERVVTRRLTPEEVREAIEAGDSGH